MQKKKHPQFAITQMAYLVMFHVAANILGSF